MGFLILINQRIHDSSLHIHACYHVSSKCHLYNTTRFSKDHTIRVVFNSYTLLLRKHCTELQNSCQCLLHMNEMQRNVTKMLPSTALFRPSTSYAVVYCFDVVILLLVLVCRTERGIKIKIKKKKEGHRRIILKFTCSLISFHGNKAVTGDQLLSGPV